MKKTFIFFLALHFAALGFGQTECAVDIYSVRDFGAVSDSVTDNTAAFQMAINAAAVKGGNVYIPAGKWLIKGSLQIKSGVCLMGSSEFPLSPYQLTGTVVLATGGRGAENAPPLFELWNASSLKGLTVYYPEQDANEIQPYPWTIYQRNPPVVHDLHEKRKEDFNVLIENITLINSYNGIRTGPDENGRHIIRNVHGCVLRRGIMVDWVGDIGRIEDIQFHCHFWSHPSTRGNWNKVFAYMQNNLEAFIFGRSDWEFVTNTFVFPAKIGYHFIQTENGACNGQFSGIAADATETCIVAEAIQSQGLLITNGQFNTHHIGRSTQVIVEPKCEGSIRFTTCGFWGPAEHNAQLLGNAAVSFMNCYFSSNYVSGDPLKPNWSIVAEHGKLQVQGCTFDGSQTDEVKQWTYSGVRKRPECILIKKTAVHAVVTGNNGWNGVSIRNEIGKKAMLRDNEQVQR